MKFSTIAGVAAFVSGAFAAPQPAVDSKALAVPAKRVDLSSIVSELTGDVADVINQAHSLSAKVQVASSVADITIVANLTSDLIALNVSLTGVVDLLNELGLGSVTSTASGVVSEAEGVVGGLLSVVTGAVGTVLSTAGGLLKGLTSRATSSATGSDSTSGDATTAVTDALGGLINASTLTSLIGGLLTAVGDLLNNLTVSISDGNLGDLSSLTNLISTGGVTGSADPISELEGTLAGLVVTVVSLLGNLLGGL